MIRGILSLGFECDFLDMRGHMHTDERFADDMTQFLRQHRGEFAFVFSTNYYSFVSIACHENDIDYIAWTYDSPWIMGNPDYYRYETSHIFMFDHDEADTYIDKGGKNFYYLPLAVNTDRFDNIRLTDADLKRFKSQGSFVGQLYSDRLNDYLTTLDDYKKGFFNGIIDYNTGIYDSYGIEDIFARDMSDWLNVPEFVHAVYEGEKNTNSPVDTENITEVLKKVNYLTSVAATNKERLVIISMLSKHWQFKLFSNHTHSIFDSSIECGTVDYETEMPKVFKASDINLNITIKCIKSGIPLRCLDIMGCGGFLLSNYQRDFDDHFTEGENIATFKSFEEAFDKFKYYTEHEDARKRVARNGYETVKEYYNFKRQLTQAIEQSGLGKLLR